MITQPLLLTLLGFSALIHAFFQLAPSILILLLTGSKTRREHTRRTVRQAMSYVTGFFASTLLLVMCAFLAIDTLFESTLPAPLLLYLTVLFAVVGVAITFMYFRKAKKGTKLWVPQSFAGNINTYMRNKQSSFSAFLVGFFIGTAEIIFTAPFFLSAGSFATQTTLLSPLALLILYATVVTVPLFWVVSYVGSGHTISTLQHWREKNKRFIQYTIGIGALLIAAVLYSYATHPDIYALALNWSQA